MPATSPVTGTAWCWSPAIASGSDLAPQLEHAGAPDVQVPMRLMHAALPGMLERRSATILNIASASAVMPRSTYGAVKNWQVQFSRWANGAYLSRGVNVTAVCPGYTHTDFHARLGLPRGSALVVSSAGGVVVSSAATDSAVDSSGSSIYSAATVGSASRGASGRTARHTRARVTTVEVRMPTSAAAAPT